MDIPVKWRQLSELNYQVCCSINDVNCMCQTSCNGLKMGHGRPCQVGASCHTPMTRSAVLSTVLTACVKRHAMGLRCYIDIPVR